MAKYLIIVELINGKSVSIETDEYPENRADGMIWVFSHTTVTRFQFVASNVLYIEVIDKRYEAQQAKEGK